jgi:hypothetical protein
VTSPVVLDDLTFDDLLRIALADIPGSSHGGWTLHGAVDPGITVLELYCWLFEQRLFMAGQPAEPVLRAALRLLGITDPRPATAAAAVLAFRAQDPPADLPAGTVMALDRDPDGRRFALTAPVTVLPVTGLTVTGTLARAGDQLELALDLAAVPPPGAVLSLLVDLAAAPGVAPGWSPDAVAVPPPADLTWTALGPGGSSPIAVTDGTGGFRRAGLVTLPCPPVWDGPAGCLLRVTATAGGWTEPVRIRGVHPNAAPAVHRVPRTIAVDRQLAGFLPLPGQRLRLPEPPGTVDDDPGSARLRLVETDGTDQVWTSVLSWTGIGPQDRVMLLDRTRGELLFGDGRVGRVPRPAPRPAATVTYAVGAGPTGNLGPGTTWVQDGGAAVATSPLPADGGADTETFDQVRARAGDVLAIAGRTVHVADIQALAEATPDAGIARALASPGFHPGFPCSSVPGAVSVTVVPSAERDGTASGWTAAPVPDRGALAAVTAQLARGRLAGQELFVRPPVYRTVAVRVTVSRTGRDDAVRARIVEALQVFLDPLRGGDTGDGWPFGGVLRPSRLAGVLRDALGPAATVSRVAVALDGGPETFCDDLPIGSRELLALGSVQVELDAALPAGTGLL